MFTPNSIPESPARAAAAATAGRRAPAPASIRGACTEIAARSRSSLTTKPLTPLSATSRLEPDPTTAIASPTPSAQPSSATSSSAPPARAKNSPSPPVRTVVRRLSGKSRWTPAGGGTALIAAGPDPAATARAGNAPRPRRSRAHQRACELLDVAGAHHHAHVALAQQACEHGLGVGEARQPVDRPAGGCVGGPLGDQQAADAGVILGALARRIDLEHNDLISLGQRGAELARQRGGARIEVRLEDGHQPPVGQRARAPQGGGHLGRVVGVDVIDRGAARAGAEQLKAPARAAPRSMTTTPTTRPRWPPPC